MASETLSSLVVLELAPSTERSTIDWFVDRLTTRRPIGAGLIVREAESVVHAGSVLLHVGATKNHLEAGAEEMGLRKRRLDTGEIRHFDRDVDGGFEPLTSADVLNVVKHYLRNLRGMKDDGLIPGLSDKVKPLYHGKSVCRRLESAGVLTQMFPLHEPGALDALKGGMLFYVPVIGVGDAWPQEGIRNYFGESIAIYFAFLRYFALALLPVVFVAVPYYVFGGRKDFEAFFIFAIYNMIWATLLIEVWKRKSARRAFAWGTLGVTGSTYEEPRSGFHGELKVHRVTGREEPHASSTVRYLKMILVSTPVVLLCMIGAAFFMELYFYFEDAALAAAEEDPTSDLYYYLGYLPSIVYSVVIFLSNAAYRPLAHRLTSFENHRTETQHLNHLVLKILLFDSFNCFGALFYVAFWMRDMQRLRADLASLLVMNQVLEQLQEIVMPYVATWKAKRRFKAGGKKTEKLLGKLRAIDGIDEDKLIQAETEADMPPYEGTFDDYLELFLHFGYISLFSCVYPLASIWAFVNNILETRTDGFKFVAVHQRPFPTPASGIGIWQLAFEIMGVLAIVTNVSLVGMSADFKATFEGVFDQWQIFMLLVFAEHLLVFLKFVVAQVIPDWPEDVRDEINRENYQSHQALRMKEKTKSE